jgi:TDG/mug DNA glycosylase family protein
MRLERVVADLEPVVVAVAGLTAYRSAFGRSGALLGPQPESIGVSRLWVVPNPSGLNAHETIESLATWYRRAAETAGLT